MPNDTPKPHRKKIAQEIVMQIRQLHSEGVKQREIAARVQVSTAAVCRILKNQRHKTQ
jgi:predicted DNA-binding protein (UPF0251 family)